MHGWSDIGKPTQLYFQPYIIHHQISSILKDILLGRPWLYDKNVIHDGRKRYKDIFKPESSTKEERSVLLTLSQLERDTQNGCMICVLVVIEREEPFKL